jgi:predicted transcriptional regulator
MPYEKERRHFMQTVKEKMAEVIEFQTDDASYEEIMRELAFEYMVDRGLEDSRKGRVVTNEEMQHRIRSLTPLPARGGSGWQAAGNALAMHVQITCL